MDHHAVHRAPGALASCGCGCASCGPRGPSGPRRAGPSPAWTRSGASPSCVSPSSSASASRLLRWSATCSVRDRRPAASRGLRLRWRACASAASARLVRRRDSCGQRPEGQPQVDGAVPSPCTHASGAKCAGDPGRGLEQRPAGRVRRPLDAAGGGAGGDQPVVAGAVGAARREVDLDAVLQGQPRPSSTRSGAAASGRSLRALAGRGPSRWSQRRRNGCRSGRRPTPGSGSADSRTRRPGRSSSSTRSSGRASPAAGVGGVHELDAVADVQVQLVVAARGTPTPPRCRRVRRRGRPPSRSPGTT